MNNLYCHAGRDGDCFWKHCPQELERRSHCPLDILKNVYHDEDGHLKSDKHRAAWNALDEPRFTDTSAFNKGNEQ